MFPVPPAKIPNNVSTKIDTLNAELAAVRASQSVQPASIVPTPTPIAAPSPTVPVVIAPHAPPRLPVPPGKQPVYFPPQRRGGPLPVSPRVPIAFQGPSTPAPPTTRAPMNPNPRLIYINANGPTNLIGEGSGRARLTPDQLQEGSVTSRILTSHTASGVAYNFKGVWSSTYNYVVGDEVIFQTFFWLCLISNTNSTPATNNPNWQALASYNGFRGAWSSTTTYVAGDEVTSGGNFWVSLDTNTNSLPTVSNPDWQIAGPASLDDVADGINRVALAATHSASNVAYNFKGAWSSVTAYVIGDEVFLNGSYWIALANNTNSQPSLSNANWQSVGISTLDSLDATAQAASIGTTTLFTAPVTGFYLVAVALLDRQTAANTSSLSAQIQWTQSGVTVAQGTPTITSNTLAAAGGSSSMLIFADASTPVKYSTSLTGAGTPTGGYDIHIRVMGPF